MPIAATVREDLVIADVADRQVAQRRFYEMRKGRNILNTNTASGWNWRAGADDHELDALND